MKTELPKTELHEQLFNIDRDFDSIGFPLYLQPVECFKEIYGSVRDEAGREKLFDPIVDWFLKKYGDSAMSWDGIIGRIPVVLKGTVYLVKIPLATEAEKVLLIDDYLEDLPADALSNGVNEVLTREVQCASGSLHKLYTLSADDCFLTKEQRQLVRRGRFDAQNASHLLKHTGDVQGAIFHAHAAAEKFFKVHLQRSVQKVDIKAFGHNLPKIFARLVENDPNLAWLDESIKELQRLLAEKMEIRYSTVERTIEEAVTAIQASLFLCGTLAQIWLFDHERGSQPAEFKAAKFYIDGSKMHYYCTKVEAGSRCAELVLFHLSNLTGNKLVEMKVSQDQCRLYLEVTDPHENAKLRNVLQMMQSMSWRKVSPEEVNLKTSSGPKGVHTTVTIRRERSS